MTRRSAPPLRLSDAAAGISGHDATHWSKGASCRDHLTLFDDAYAHIHEQAGRSRKAGEHWTVVEAKKVCNGSAGNPPCPALQACRENILANPDRYGVWGGWTPRERDAMRRKARR